MYKVFINPGHCLGVDSGAVNEDYGVQESAIVAEVGSMVESYLIAAGYETKVIQSDNLAGESQGPNVTAEANAWEASVFVSIHCNAATNKAAKGTETLIYKGGSDSEDLAYYIQEQICESLEMVDRGIKERPELIVLKRTEMPAVLVELGFISNDEDCEKLIVSKDDFAAAVARGITDYFELML